MFQAVKTCKKHEKAAVEVSSYTLTVSFTIGYNAKQGNRHGHMT